MLELTILVISELVMKLFHILVLLETPSRVSLGVFDNTVVQTWNTGALVRKYEMNGVSLRRINAEHYLGSSGDNEAITLDSYKIEIDMSDTTRGINRTSSGSFRSLHFNKTRNGGGNQWKINL